MSQGLNKSFWKNKKVLITGHTGFKGGWLCLWLHKLGAQCIGYSLKPNTNPSFYEICRIDQITTSIYQDINNFEEIKSVISSYQPEIIIHMAAQSLVSEAFDNPLEAIKTNVIGTTNLLEAIRANDCVQAALIVTTDKCYDISNNKSSYQESAPLGGHEPYSASKASAEFITQAYRNCFFKKLCSARAGNIIGGGDWNKNRLIPDMIKKLYNNQSPMIRNPNHTRPWQFVLEPLLGYLKLIEHCFSEKDNYFQAWNFGPNYNKNITVSHVADLLCNLWDRNIQWQCDDKNDHTFVENKYLSINSNAAKNKLNWRTILSLEESLQLLVNWHKSFKDNIDMQSYSLKQISLYEEKIYANLNSKN